MDLSRFHGIHPILYAYFDAAGHPQRAPIAAQVEAAIRHGAHGVAVLGLATETNKLDAAERRAIVEWTAEAVAKRLPLAVTVAEPSVHGQVAFVRAARDAGADWVILQPPPVAGLLPAPAPGRVAGGWRASTRTSAPRAGGVRTGGGPPICWHP